MQKVTFYDQLNLKYYVTYVTIEIKSLIFSDLNVFLLLKHDAIKIKFHVYNEFHVYTLTDIIYAII